MGHGVDADITNESQMLSFTGDTLSLCDSSKAIDLSPITPNNADDGDADPFLLLMV